MKKLFLGLGASAIALAMVPLFAAFEAHVINVTARIENVLEVDTALINFGTIFPQESLTRPLTVALSQSFNDEPRVDDVNYHIRQKPKCGITSNNGQTLDDSSAKTGEVIPDQSVQGYRVDCGPAPRQLQDDEVWGMLPMLCPYISKHLIAGSGTLNASTPIFLLDTDETTYTTIYRVDRTTGQLTTVGSIPTTFGFSLGLAAKSDNVLYVVTLTGEVLEVNMSPFSMVSLGNIGANFIVGLAYADGRLYATDETADTLSIIQLSPLAKIPVGTIRLGGTAGPVFDVEGGDIAEDGSGSWFLWGNARQALYRLDVNTAVVTPVSVAWLGTKTGLAFDYLGDGALLGSSGPLNTLAVLDPTTGTSSSPVDFCLNGSCPPPYNHRYGDLASPSPWANTSGMPSFHQPFNIISGAVQWLDTPGYLAKAIGDLVDNWVVDIHTPCFQGQCSEDWANYVHRANPQADPSAYIQPAENEHKIFGCDLWVEVTDINNNEQG